MLHLTTSIDFLELDEEGLAIAVTGGTGDFYGATGELLTTPIGDPEDGRGLVTGTVLLHGTR